MFTFGEQSMANAMSRQAGGDGRNTMYTIKLSSTGTMPSCLSSCNLPLSPAAGTCFIDHHCFADGTYSSYGAHQCHTCNSSANALGWSDPDTSAHCFIDGQCVADGTPQPGVGYRAPPSACMYCDVSMSTTSWSLRSTYTLSSTGACNMRPSAPPAPPAPPPSPSPPADTTVSFVLVASGAVSDYTTVVVDSIAQSVAATIDGVNADSVTVTVLAASVRIEVSIG